MDYSQFTKLYPLSKTLRFELKPVGETADYIEDYGSEYLKSVVRNDEKRYDDYQTIKGLIDDLHRGYISSRLGFDKSGVLGHPRDIKTGEELIGSEDLIKAFELFKATKKTYEDDKKKASALKDWDSHQIVLRKKLVEAFNDKKMLFGKELIQKELPDFLKQRGDWDEHKELVESFNTFTTYFTGFHENRKNMYSPEDKATSIANRAINENLPRFFDNILVVQKIASSEHSVILKEVDDLLVHVQAESTDEVFAPGFYLKLFTQQGIEAYQSLLSGPDVEEGNDKVHGLNQIISQYRQQYNSAEQEETKLTNRNFPTLVSLHKQILAETTRQSYSYEPYETDAQLLAELNVLRKEYDRSNGFFGELISVAESIQESDPETIYIRSNALSNLSHAWLGNFGILNRAFEHFVEKSGDFAKATAKKNRLQLIDPKKKKVALFSLAEIDRWLAKLMEDQDDEANSAIVKALELNGNTVALYFSTAVKNSFRAKESDAGSIQEIESKVDKLLSLTELSSKRRPPKSNGENDLGDEGYFQVQTIQQWLDGYLSALNTLKPLHLIHGRKPLELPDNQDKGLYNSFSDLFELMNDGLLTVFNKSRNYLTKKKYSNEKVKINFENPNLMSGWDANKETDNSCVLFEKEGLYYLGVMHPKHRRLFDFTVGIDELGKSKIVEKKEALNELVSSGGEGFRKIVYKLLPGANKMLPKVFFSNSRIDFFAPSEEVQRIRNTASHSKGGTPQKGYSKAEFNLKDCHVLIDFFKASIEKHYEWRQYNFKWSPTISYQDISAFYKELQDQAYKIEFHHIKDSYIDECIKDGELFLFQIYNKDFSKYSKGTPNLHTLYWRGLFEPENLKDVVLKLNGEAEMFFRSHSIKKKNAIVHRAGEKIPLKNSDKKGEFGQFKYDIVKDKRYTKDKFFLHVPITLNHKASGENRFNDAINKAITNDTNVIGIDRGERHLLYFCLINSKGDIIKQGSLNTISPAGGGEPVDYQKKLDVREKQRDEARKSWTAIENIKELKEGYLSQVVHKITQLMVEHNAIVCLEDLNFGFKRGRFKVEKQVYQKFEKALINKLNYIVDKKETNPKKPRHYLNAMQLAAPFISFEKMGKQSGALYYVRADYTSKICPVTGFINLLKPYYQSVEKSQLFFSNFESIRFNGKDFEFGFDYKKTNPTAKLKGSKTSWVVTSHGDRIVGKKNEHNKWESTTLKPTDEIIASLSDAEIDWQSQDNILDEVLAQSSKRFFQSLMWCLRITLQMRNSRPNSTESDDDYLVSPIAYKEGGFYDSRDSKDGLPKDADANGAYHIALKGLWNIDQIVQHDWSVEKPKPLKLNMSNEEWFAFIQNKAYRGK